MIRYLQLRPQITSFCLCTLWLLVAVALLNTTYPILWFGATLNFLYWGVRGVFQEPFHTRYTPYRTLQATELNHKELGKCCVALQRFSFLHRTVTTSGTLAQFSKKTCENYCVLGWRLSSATGFLHFEVELGNFQSAGWAVSQQITPISVPKTIVF